MIDYDTNIYKSQPKCVIKEHGIRIFSSYKNQMVGHNASDFDKYIVLNSLPSSYICTKTKKNIHRFNKIKP